MHRLVSTLCCTAAVAWLPLPARAEIATSTLTLDLALHTALAHSPALAEAEAAVAQARGRRVGAALHSNPELSIHGAARVLDEGGARPDLGVELSQAVLLGGQRDQRVAVADAEVREAAARLRHTRQVVATRVHLAFIDALRAQELSALAVASAQLARRLFTASERRLSAGDSTLLDVHVSRAELGRADNALTDANVEAVAAHVELAAAMGQRLTTPFRLVPPPPRARALPPLETVLDAAAARRADLEALHGAVDAARARVELASADAVPSLTVRAFVELEGGADVIAGGGLSLPLPLFDRNQGGVAEARAAHAREQAALRVGELELAREIATAYALYVGAARSEAAFEAGVVGSMEETVDLLRRTFDAGKIGFTEVVVLRRSLIEARVVAVEARARAARAGVILDVALGTIGAPVGAEEVQP